MTINEKRVLRFLASAGKDYSINDIAKACKLTPNGAHKLLVKMEKEGVLKVKPIANLRAYQLDFDSEKTVPVLELAFMPDALEGRVKLREEDLKQLRAVTNACILFGSYITTKKEPGDLDVLFVLERKHFEAYKKVLAKVQDITPLKIQDVVQTAGDIEQNLKKNDPIVTEAIRNGIVLWGFDVLVRVIKNASR
ncbi:helix-turn-helix domain-containing protein [Candidatus Woesearchaeota archaeon]|nr:helix-turn-helix domain-containing protein [Candidatus Woesearchaeota archaeon]